MLVANITREISLTPQQALPVYAIAVCLLYAGILVHRRMARRIETRGGQVRTDFFGLPDLVVVGVFVVLMVLALAMQWVLPSAGAGRAGLQIVSSVLFLSLPVILALLVVRGFSLPLVFGMKRVGLFRAILTAIGLILLLLPMLMLVTAIATQLLGGQPEQQEMVKTFREATRTGKQDVVWQVILTATLIAPITEEFLFRGYFYPVIKRAAGPLPAAVGISMLFGAVHNNAAGFPVLTVLALGLTLAYEWCGSILVPILMHACFNAVMLSLMWWQTTSGFAP